MLVHIILLNLIFHKANHHLQALVESDGCPASSIKLFGQPLIVRNIRMTQQAYGISKVMIPSEFSSVIKLVQQSFPSIEVQDCAKIILQILKLLSWVMKIWRYHLIR